MDNETRILSHSTSNGEGEVFRKGDSICKQIEPDGIEIAMGFVWDDDIEGIVVLTDEGHRFNIDNIVKWESNN